MRLLWFALLAGCGPEHRVEGIAVGNPGTFKPKTAVAARIAFNSASGGFSTVDLLDCDGGSRRIAERVILQLLGASSLSLPPGEWCALRLVAEEPMVFSLEGTSGGSAQLTLAVQSLSLTNDTGFVIDGQSLLLEVGSPDWLDEATLGIEGGDDVEIKPDDTQHDFLVDVIETESSLFEDVDGDGLITNADALIADAAGIENGDPETAAPTTGCMTATSAAGATVGWWIGAALLGLRRRIGWEKPPRASRLVQDARSSLASIRT
ncbi:MAG: hypothetical protein AAFV53_08995 [Myxococcota bacterium]